jgi:hypothetical protein
MPSRVSSQKHPVGTLSTAPRLVWYAMQHRCTPTGSALLEYFRASMHAQSLDFVWAIRTMQQSSSSTHGYSPVAYAQVSQPYMLVSGNRTAHAHTCMIPHHTTAQHTAPALSIVACYRQHLAGPALRCCFGAGTDTHITHTRLLCPAHMRFHHHSPASHFGASSWPLHNTRASCPAYAWRCAHGRGCPKQ